MGQDERQRKSGKVSIWHIKNCRMEKNCMQITRGKAGKTLTAEVSSLMGLFNTLVSGCFRRFSEKKTPKRTWLCTEISPLLFGLRTWSKCQKTWQVFLSALKKIFFAWGVRVFCEWCHKWSTFRPPWSTLPGPGRQPLGGSISLKFLLETRLQSESFDTLDDLLGFRIQKL